MGMVLQPAIGPKDRKQSTRLKELLTRVRLSAPTRQQIQKLIMRTPGEPGPECMPRPTAARS